MEWQTNIPLVDLKAQYHSIKVEIDHAISQVIERGQFILGPEVKAFEQEIATYLGVKHAVGVASGTEALQLALLACGVKPGDKVITTPFTFIATAEAITQCGATPVFVDIDPQTYNIDPQKLEDLLSSTNSTNPTNSMNSTNPTNSVGQPKAVIPVHLYGQPADMDPIMDLAQKYNLRVIEDCAQSLGAIYYRHQSPNSMNSTNSMNPKNCHRVGSLGDAGCLSFFPSKVLGAYGDGGMVVTNNPDIAEKVAMLRNHGCKQKYYHLVPGFNSRLDSLQAAILRVKLTHLDEWLEQRHQKASLYSELLGQIKGIEPPFVAPYGSHVFNYYTVRIRDSNNVGEEPVSSLSTKQPRSRHSLQEHLAYQGIATAIYYPLSLHLQEVYKPLGYKTGDFPQSERASEEVLSLPIYPELAARQIEEVAGAVRNFRRMEERGQQ